MSTMSQNPVENHGTDFDEVFRENAPRHVQDGASGHPAARGDRRVSHLLLQAGPRAASRGGGAGVADTTH